MDSHASRIGGTVITSQAASDDIIPEPAWVTYATPACIVAIVAVCFIKICCRACKDSRRGDRSESRERGSSDNFWFVRSRLQFTEASGIPPNLEAFTAPLPDPPKYEDVVRAKSDEEREGWVEERPPEYSPATSPTILSPSGSIAPPAYSSIPRRHTVISVEEAPPAFDEGRDNQAYVGEAESHSRPRLDGMDRSRVAALDVESLHAVQTRC